MKSRSFLAACAVMVGGALSPTFGATIDVALEDFQASGVLSYRYMGGDITNGSAGLFRLRTQNPSGPETEILGDPLYAFCIELEQAFSGDFHTYDLVPVTSATNPPAAAFGTISPESAALMSQLWYKFFDPSWTALGPYSDTQITECMAFHSLLYEISIDFDGVDLGSIDLTTGNFIVTAAHILDVNDPLQELPVLAAASTMLLDLSLTYDGPLANLSALTNPTYQDFLVQAVPEASSMVLAGMGVLSAAGYIRLKRRRPVTSV